MKPPTRYKIFEVFNLLKTRLTNPKDSKKLIGQDYMGNKYYELFRANCSRQHQRLFERPGEHDAVIQDILERPVPPAWDAWLRYRRREAPTDEEVQDGIDYFELQQARDAENKLKAKMQKEGANSCQMSKTGSEDKHEDHEPKSRKGFPILPIK